MGRKGQQQGAIEKITNVAVQRSDNWPASPLHKWPYSGVTTDQPHPYTSGRTAEWQLTSLTPTQEKPDEEQVHTLYHDSNMSLCCYFLTFRISPFNVVRLLSRFCITPPTIFLYLYCMCSCMCVGACMIHGELSECLTLKCAHKLDYRPVKRFLFEKTTN